MSFVAMSTSASSKKKLLLSDPSSITPGASTSNSSNQKSFKYDVFISFCGIDIRNTFFAHLYQALKDKKLAIFYDVEKIKRGKKISDELIKAIEDSKYYIIVFSKNYASSSWCLQELVKIMECQKMDEHTAYPVFYDVEPTEVRYQSGAVGKAFARHVKEVRKKRWAFGLAVFMKKKKAMLNTWKKALEEAHALDRNGAECIQSIVQDISQGIKGITKEGSITSIQDVHVPPDNLTDPAPSTTFAHLDAKGIYPAVDLAGGELKNTLDGHKSKEWKGSLKRAAGLAGLELKNTLDGNEAKFIQKIVHEISLELRSINSDFDENLVGMETRVEDVVSSLKMEIDDEVLMVGIKGMGESGKTTTARAVFDHLSNHFEANSFVYNVREEASTILGLKKLQEKVLSDVKNEQVTLSSVNDGMMKRGMRGIKVLLVLDDVDHIDQLKALANARWFEPGSRILITTRDEQVLKAHGVQLIRDIPLLSDQEATSLFSRHAFGKENPLQGYEKLSEKVVRYAAGLPSTLKVLGSSLCGNKDKNDWVDCIESLEKFPEEDTLKSLQLSYDSLKNDRYREIFLDIACILKGESKDDAIRILESCWCHARFCLTVLEQRSLITLSSKYGQLVLGMHDRIEEMGKYIVRSKHPDEPNKRSRLWNREEVENILPEGKGTEETKCLKFYMSRGNVRDLMKGLGKMEKLRYLELNLVRDFDSERDDACLGSDLKFDDKSNRSARIVMKMKVLGKIEQKSERDEATQYFPNSLIYLRCENYPFLYLPKTFQANNLVGLEMESSRRMVQLWEDGEKKVLKELKYLSLYRSKLTVFDFWITPNLESLSLKYSSKLNELRMPDTCQKLKHLNISESELRTFDLGLTPNLETLSLESSRNLEELCMPVGGCQKLKHLNVSLSKLRTFDLGLTPNLETLSLEGCAQFEELQVSAECPNLKFLNLRKSRLTSLNLELIPNLESLDLYNCDELIEITAPAGCMEKVGSLNLSSSLRFTDFSFYVKFKEPKVNCFSATLALFGESVDSCPLHPNSNLPKLRFHYRYREYLPSSDGNIEKIMSFGPCACIDFKRFSDMICSLRLKKLELRGNIPGFPKDLGKLECLEELCLSSTQITHLPDSIFGLKGLLIDASPELLQKYENHFSSVTKRTSSWRVKVGANNG